MRGEKRLCSCIFRSEIFIHLHSDFLCLFFVGCICNLIGTDRAGGDCNRVSGQCPCLPNVIGKDCGQCAPAHWNMDINKGCDACHCDPAGSLSLDCNQVCS